jgi:hypothetical protein
MRGESPQRYLFFVIMVGLVWSYGPDSYASSSIAIRRASHAREVESYEPIIKGIPWSSRLVVGA